MALVFVFWATGTASLAQNGSVTLGSATGFPGEHAELPLYLGLPKNHPFERIVARVEYSTALTDPRVKEDEKFKASGATMEVKEQTAPAGGKSKRIEITIRAGQGKLLPDGLIGWLLFSINKDARPQMLSLPMVEPKGFNRRGEAEVRLRGDPGNITIYEPGTEPPPLVPCFFFTH